MGILGNSSQSSSMSAPGTSGARNGYAPVATTEESAGKEIVIAPSFTERIGLKVLNDLCSDGKRLFLSKSVRMFSFGFLSVMLVVYLQELGISDKDIGLMFSLTLFGDMLISLYLTGVADRLGRRNCLLIGSTLSFLTGLIFASQRNYWLLLFAAIVGVISPSGNEVGPFMAIEVSSLAQVTAAAQCTLIMAWYNLFGYFSAGFGALFCGFVIAQLRDHNGWTMLEACRLILFIYSILQFVKGALFYSVSPEIEVPQRPYAPADSSATAASKPTSFCCGGLKKSRSIVIKLSVLFCLDSFAGAFVLQSLTSAWFVRTWHTNPRLLGTLIFSCNFVAGVSALLAAPLANMIGLIMTMTVTHLPSNVLLILVPLMPNEKLAVMMLCLRYCISQMDVPTRNAYVSGVVAADERSASQGVTNVIRSLGAAVAPYIAERLYMVPSQANYPFYIAGTLKIVYDCALVYSFLSVKTEHEKSQAQAKTATSTATASEELKDDKSVGEDVEEGDLEMINQDSDGPQ
jgi:MFS family permease